jgi:hypothetical protein
VGFEVHDSLFVVGVLGGEKIGLLLEPSGCVLQYGSIRIKCFIPLLDHDLVVSSMIAMRHVKKWAI